MPSARQSRLRGICKKCGGPKPIVKGRQYCDQCRAEQHDAAIVAKRSAEKTRALAAPPGQKWCSRCDNDLPLAQFGTRANSDRPQAYCIPCQKSYMHERRIEKHYGLTGEDYANLLAMQGGRCAICRVKPRTAKLAVDHDHDSGEVRGLLCMRCNHKLLGAARDREDILRRAARYLDAPPAEMGTVEHLGPDAAWIEAQERWQEVVAAAGDDVPALVWQPDNATDLEAGEYLVTFRFEDAVNLLHAAGYGDSQNGVSA